MYSIVIKNGTIIDGTGKKRFNADIGVEGDKITAIGDLSKVTSQDCQAEIDAANLFVAPGFIDINNHSDNYWTFFTSPKLESLVRQGITTIIGGNCGSSLAPLMKGEDIVSIRKWVDIGQVNIDWLDVEGFYAVLRKKKLGVNFATLVGHENIRRSMLKDDIRQIMPSEMTRMEEILEKALSDGALGLSTGLIYSHAKLATTEEIIQLAKIVKKHNGIYSSHIRGEADGLVESVEEAIKIGKESGVSVEISHIKAVGEKNWPYMEKALEKIAEAVDSGLDINFDIYPYTVTGSVLYVLLPEWVALGGKKKMLERLKDPDIKSKIIKEMQEQSSFDYKKISISMCPYNKYLIGKKVMQIAENQKTSPEEAVTDILLASEGQAICFLEALNEDNVRKGISHWLSIIGSNAAGYDLEHKKTGELIHPRCFGAFAKILGTYVREQKLLNWETAINKMTAMPADKLKLKKRGVLAPGNFADIAIFNPDTIAEKATFENPYQYAEGMRYVLINGKAVLDEAKHTGVLAGKILKR